MGRKKCEWQEKKQGTENFRSDQESLIHATSSRGTASKDSAKGQRQGHQGIDGIKVTAPASLSRAEHSWTGWTCLARNTANDFIGLWCLAPTLQTFSLGSDLQCYSRSAFNGNCCKYAISLPLCPFSPSLFHSSHSHSHLHSRFQSCHHLFASHYHRIVATVISSCKSRSSLL